MTAAAVRAEELLDELTLRRAQRGDESAWRALIERFQPPVHALIWRLLIEHKMLDWRYRPFLVDGKPTAVCTEVTFIYQQVSEPKDHRSSTANHDSSTASQSACASTNVEGLVKEAANQYTDGGMPVPRCR
jgi:hypothetical protein